MSLFRHDARMTRAKLPHRRIGHLLIALCGLLSLYSRSTPAQSVSVQKEDKPDLPEFEVASVRIVPPSKQGLTELGPYGTSLFTFRNASLGNLLQLAFDTASLVGAPKGLNDAVFDIEAKTANGLPLTYESLKPQLQQLLQQRFGLVAHLITSNSPGFSLVIAKHGPKLTPATSGAEAHAYILRDELLVSAGSLKTFALVLANVVHRPVEDDTALSGKWEIQLRFAPEDSIDSQYPQVFTALREQLGLELKPHLVPTSKLLIAHLNLIPSDN